MRAAIKRFSLVVALFYVEAVFIYLYIAVVLKRLTKNFYIKTFNSYTVEF